MWGMIRSAALEIDSRVLSMVCIDTDDVVGAKEAWRQVWQELVVSNWNARSASASGDDGSNTVAEVEVCYRGKSRYVRRLCSHKYYHDIDIVNGLLLLETTRRFCVAHTKQLVLVESQMH